jgi:predicted house-cleaning noncanonical NTP pyrophosphatase (MazG superfamily)
MAPKLVRDGIPARIKADGLRPVTHLELDDSRFRLALLAKLQEEVAEFLQSEEPEELADILEVVYAIAELRGVNYYTLNNMRWAKAESRGTFKNRVILDKIEKP